MARFAASGPVPESQARPRRSRQSGLGVTAVLVAQVAPVAQVGQQGGDDQVQGDPRIRDDSGLDGLGWPERVYRGALELSFPLASRSSGVSGPR